MDYVYQQCPHCGEEIELRNAFEVQECSECGEEIRPCSICLRSGKGKYPCTAENCPVKSQKSSESIGAKAKRYRIPETYLQAVA